MLLPQILVDLDYDSVNVIVEYLNVICYCVKMVILIHRDVLGNIQVLGQLEESVNRLDYDFFGCCQILSLKKTNFVI